MDENDRSNLNFLLYCSVDILKEWFDAVEETDHLYASSLMTIAELELLDAQTETNIAEQILKRYML